MAYMRIFTRLEKFVRQPIHIPGPYILLMWLFTEIQQTFNTNIKWLYCDIYHKFQFGGVCLVIIGIWARLEKSPPGSLDNLSTDPVLILLIVGSIMCSISIVGCLGSLRENICLLKAVSCTLIDIKYILSWRLWL